MEDVRGRMELCALPGWGVGVDLLCLNGPLPELQLRQLLRPDVPQERETGGEGPREAAPLALEGLQEAFKHPRLHVDVVIEHQRVAAAGPVHEVVALLGYAVFRLPGVPLDGAAALLDHASGGENRGLVAHAAAALLGR